MEIQELQEQLNVLTNEYNTLKKTNESIFNLKKDFKNKNCAVGFNFGDLNLH